MGKKKSNKAMSNVWLYGFLERWSGELASLTSRRLESTRAKATSPDIVENYFKNLQDTIEKYDLTDKPQHIYNIDETGITPDHRPPNVIATPGSNPQSVTSPRSTTTTNIVCANAIGNSVPPYFIFKGKRFNPDLLKGASPGTKGVMSDPGWSNCQIFQEYLKDHFLPFARDADSTQPILEYMMAMPHIRRQV